MEKSETHNRLPRKGKRKGKEKHTSEKMQHKLEEENHRSRIRVVARVGEKEGAQSNKLRNWENERGRKFKKLKHKKLKSSGKPKGCAKTHQSAHAMWQQHT